MLRMRIIVLEIAANCVKFIRNAGKRVRAAVAQTGLSFIECSLFVSKRTAQNECKAERLGHYVNFTTDIGSI